jgi:hypothetical protein
LQRDVLVRVTGYGGAGIDSDFALLGDAHLSDTLDAFKERILAARRKLPGIGTSDVVLYYREKQQPSNADMTDMIISQREQERVTHSSFATLGRFTAGHIAPHFFVACVDSIRGASLFCITQASTYTRIYVLVLVFVFVVLVSSLTTPCSNRKPCSVRGKRRLVTTLSIVNCAGCGPLLQFDALVVFML